MPLFTPTKPKFLPYLQDKVKSLNPRLELNLKALSRFRNSLAVIEKNIFI